MKYNVEIWVHQQGASCTLFKEIGMVDSQSGTKMAKDEILEVLTTATEGGLERLHRQMQVLQALTELLPGALNGEVLGLLVVDLLRSTGRRG